MKKIFSNLVMLIIIATMILALGGCAKPAQDTPDVSEETPALDYPTEAIKVIVQFNPGGGSDLLARVFATAVSDMLPEPVVVENRPGAGGVVGTTEMVKSDPDGYTFSSQLLGCITIQPNLGNTVYEYTDMKPIIGLTSDPCVLVVSKDMPFDTVEGFVEFAKEEEGKFVAGFAGSGTIGYLATVALADEAGFVMTEVQYDGGSEAYASVLGGHTMGYATTLSGVVQHLESGEIKLIYVTAPSEYAPGIEVLNEVGYDINIAGRTALYAPSATPDEIVKIIHDAYRTAMNDEGVKKICADKGIGLEYQSGEDFQKIIDEEYVVTREVLKAIGKIQE
jgi:tripartite-type tricarboxylate transporter receptor subunit TctC